MKFNWIGDAFEYGSRLNFFSISAHNVELNFVLYPVSDPDDDAIFGIQRSSKNPNTINKEIEIDEDIEEVYLIETDNDFRKKFKRSYQMMKFVTSDHVISVGIYNDNGKQPTPDNSYLLCTTDFINLLADSKKIENADQIKDTPFRELMCIFSKKELAKELLK